MATLLSPRSRVPQSRIGIVLPAILALALWVPSALAADGPPVNTERPALSGNARYGHVLTATQGTWTGSEPITYAYQWRRCDSDGNNCSDIAGATGLTYTLGLSDIGSRLYIRVTASNAYGTASKRSWLSATVVSAPINLERPALSGIAHAGQTVSGSTGTWAGTQPIAYAYQWKRCDADGSNCANIAGASGSSYVLTTTDVGKRVHVRVTGTNTHGSAAQRSWNSAVVTGAPVNTAPPSISGTAQVGQPLNASSGSWSGTEPITYGYQWRRCDTGGTACTDISGASAPSYTLVSADEGSTLRVRVTATNAWGSAAADSAQTAVVTGSSSGSLYYVAPNGSDSNPGTEAQPWKTPQKAMDAMNPGDTTYVKAGTYGRTVCDSSSGDGGSAGGGFVTLKAYPGDSPVLTASNDGVIAIDCDYLRVEGLVVEGPGAVGGTLVYGMTDSDHVQIVGNEVRDSICQGIYTEEETADYEILRNWIHNNGTSACDRQAHGIYLQGDRHLVANNVIHDHPRGFGIQNYDYSRDVRIVGNTITHAGHGGIVVGGSGCGPSGCKVDNTVVVGNIVAYNGTYGIDRDSTAPTSCSIHHNLAFQNGSGSYDSGWPSGCFGSNATADPLFVNVGARDLHLQSGSPAIDAGDPAFVFSPDFDGVARPQGSGPDIGAFER